MPELPDITIYVEALRSRIVGEPLERIRILKPFVLRSIAPSAAELELRLVESVSRLSKRIIIGLQQEKFIVIHLMIAGRLLWRPPGARPPGKLGMAAFDFPNGSLLLTEASTKKRASIHFVLGESGLHEHARTGIEVASIAKSEFEALLRAENRTVKRALTDPNTFDGIGNAYSDEILHAAKLAPTRLTNSLNTQEIARLHDACCATLDLWTDKLRLQFKDRFPGSGEITAFRPDFAVHGKFGQPCPVCAKPVQRIVYADRETNYCAECQNGGRVLADRALSRLLRDDFPRELD